MILSWEAEGDRLHAYVDGESACGQSQLLAAPIASEATRRDNRWKGVVFDECDDCVRALMLDKIREQIAQAHRREQGETR